MKKPLYTIVACAALSLLTAACADYLDIKNNNKLAVPNTLRDLQALLDNFEIMNTEATPSYLEAAADNYFLTDSRYAATNELQKPLYEWLPVDYGFQNDWGKSYTLVYNANFCLDMLKNIERTEASKASWDNIYGSALFFRAYSYLGLLWTYAPVFDPIGPNEAVGIVLRSSSDFNIPSQRSSVKEGYQQIITDLEQAVGYLPVKPIVKSRPSQWAAYALLARAYLSMSNYEEAGRYADLALDIDNTLMDYNNPEDGILISANVPFARFNKETIFYSDIAMNFRLHIPNTGSYVDTVLYASYVNDDLRKTAFFRPNEGYQRFKGTYSHSPNWLFSGLTTSEMYFIKMESLARTSAYLEAVNMLEHLMRYRWRHEAPGPVWNVGSPNEALDLILTERRKELVMRGLRLADIKRLGLEDGGMVLRRRVGIRLIEVPATSERLILNLPRDIEDYIN